MFRFATSNVFAAVAGSVLLAAGAPADARTSISIHIGASAPVCRVPRAPVQRVIIVQQPVIIDDCDTARVGSDGRFHARGRYGGESCDSRSVVIVQDTECRQRSIVRSRRGHRW